MILLKRAMLYFNVVSTKALTSSTLGTRPKVPFSAEHREICRRLRRIGLKFSIFLCLLVSVADKGIQHVSPFCFPWPLGSGFSSTFLTELKNSMNHHNHAAVSNERQRILRWNIDAVANHVRTIGCADQAKIFSEQVRTDLHG